MTQTVGIIGYGNFGRFCAAHVGEHVTVRVYDPAVADADNTLEEVCASDIVIFAVPMNALAQAIDAAKELIPTTTRIVDVTSVKEKPLALLKQAFPQHQILGTHPIFGPQAGKHGIAGLPIVFVNVSWDKDAYAAVRAFCSDTLSLRVIEQTADQHDKEMAHVMALSHFIGRALKHLDIKEYETSTFSYSQLLELRDLLIEDSWDLFETIQNENPYAHAVRESFLDELHSLRNRLSK